MPSPKDPESRARWLNNLSSGAKKRQISESGRDALKKARAGKNNPNYGKKHSEETRKKISEAVKRNRKPNSPETAALLSRRQKESWAIDDARKCAAAERSRNRMRTEEERQRLSESKILALNDIWYGGVKYNDYKPPQYCIKWNANLRNRIRACWGHKSVLSGATKEDNNNRALCCHHVYYQKKACCEWDEDSQGYYCYIDGARYDIKGDPNKFVTLTNAENSMVNFDKLKWVKIFEGIIERNGGVCYSPKQLSPPTPTITYGSKSEQVDSESQTQAGRAFSPTRVSCEG